ncbi:MAG: hypothetical protein PHF86_12855 [Candidatus Nanoarchaeia archaeon]|nr:hypothetical protein [Candidatus Nanoarchaeia archaeon]
MESKDILFYGITGLVSIGFIYEVSSHLNSLNLYILENRIEEVKKYLNNRNVIIHPAHPDYNEERLKIEKTYSLNTIKHIKKLQKQNTFKFLPGRHFFEGIKKRRELCDLLEQI